MTKRKQKIAAKEHSLQKISATTETQKASTPADVMATVTRRLTESTGVEAPTVAALVVDQVRRGSLASETDGLEIALDALRELQPKNLIEAQLAAQLYTVHNRAMEYMEKSSAGPRFTGSDQNLVRAMELLRLYRDLTETLLKVRGQTGQQKIVIERVDVREGGQAIVGSVSAIRANARGGGYGRDEGNTP